MGMAALLRLGKLNGRFCFDGGLALAFSGTGDQRYRFMRNADEVNHFTGWATGSTNLFHFPQYVV